MERAEIDALKADLRRMQARVDELEAASEEPVNRRNMLRGLGAAAAGAAVGGLAFARPAAATDGNTLIIGDAAQTSQSPTQIVADTSWSASPLVGILSATNDPTFSNINAAVSCISAYANSAETGGHNVGLWSRSANGIGAKLDGPVPLKLTDNSGSGAPNQSQGSIGQFKVEGLNGNLWFCVDDNSSHNWRKLAGLSTAGAFHALTPKRVYDSRAASPAQGTLAAGSNRLVSIKDGRDSVGAVTNLDMVPAGATAITANVTVTATTTAFGYLAINPGGDTVEGASTINWSTPGQTIANGVTLKINSSRQVTVICNGLAGAVTPFIIDVTGYYL